MLRIQFGRCSHYADHHRYERADRQASFPSRRDGVRGPDRHIGC